MHFSKLNKSNECNIKYNCFKVNISFMSIHIKGSSRAFQGYELPLSLFTIPNTFLYSFNVRHIMYNHTRNIYGNLTRRWNNYNICLFCLTSLYNLWYISVWFSLNLVMISRYSIMLFFSCNLVLPLDWIKQKVKRSNSTTSKQTWMSFIFWIIICTSD